MRPLILSVALAAAGLLSTSLHAGTPAAKAEVARVAAQLLEGNYQPDGPGAALLVARGDEVLYQGARGRADVAAGTPLAADSVFRIASVTKQMSAAGLLLLVEAGEVGLEDPLSQYLPDFPNGAAITVRQLLNHTSGVKSYTEIPGVMEGPVQQDVTTAQLIDSFKQEQPDFAPGAGWAYNNSGYVLVGAVIEAVTGQPWHRYLETALFAPLGMDHTHYGADPAVVQARGYSLDAGKVAPARPLSMTQPHAAGALVSTVGDLHTWNRALHEGRVLKSDTYRQMITPDAAAAQARYGFGIFHETLRGADALSHGGGIFGAQSYLLYLPGSDTSVAIVQNTDANGPGREPVQNLARRLAALAIGAPYPAATPVAVDVAALKQAEGVYRIDPKAARVLRVVDGRLTAQRTGGARSPLTPIAKDTFLYADGFNRVAIERDAQGGVTGMRFFPQGEGAGEFVARSNEPLPAARTAIALPRDAIERVTGRYVGKDGMPLKVFVDGDNILRAQLGGQPSVELFAESPERFFVTVVDATLEFAPPPAAAQTVVLTQGPGTMAFTRAPE